MSKYPFVLQPLTLNQVTLRNRIIFPAFQTNYAHSNGTASAKLIDFYSQIADHQFVKKSTEG